MKRIKQFLTVCAAGLLATAFAPFASAQILFDSDGYSYVAYNTSTSYTSNSLGQFSFTYYTTFAPTDFDPAEVMASFGVTLTDGTRGGTGVTVTNLLQTATLTSTTNQVVDLTNADLSLPTLTALHRSTTTESTQNSAFPGYDDTDVNGTFDELTVTVTGTLSSGAELGATGVVDTMVEIPLSTPEPSAMFLALIAAVAFAVCVFRKRLSVRQ
jgi:hypothetical protein